MHEFYIFLSVFLFFYSCTDCIHNNYMCTHAHTHTCPSVTWNQKQRNFHTNLYYSASYFNKKILAIHETGQINICEFTLKKQYINDFKLLTLTQVNNWTYEISSMFIFSIVHLLRQESRIVYLRKIFNYHEQNKKIEVK